MIGYAAADGWLGPKLSAYRWLWRHRGWLRRRRRRCRPARRGPRAELTRLFADHLQPGNLPPPAGPGAARPGAAGLLAPGAPAGSDPLCAVPTGSRSRHRLYDAPVPPMTTPSCRPDRPARRPPPLRPRAAPGQPHHRRARLRAAADHPLPRPPPAGPGGAGRDPPRRPGVRGRRVVGLLRRRCWSTPAWWSTATSSIPAAGRRGPPGVRARLRGRPQHLRPRRARPRLPGAAVRRHARAPARPARGAARGCGPGCAPTAATWC